MVAHGRMLTLGASSKVKRLSRSRNCAKRKNGGIAAAPSDDEAGAFPVWVRLRPTDRSRKPTALPLGPDTLPGPRERWPGAQLGTTQTLPLRFETSSQGLGLGRRIVAKERH